MSDVTLSKAVRSNLLNLQNTASLMSKTQERLATGLRVNSALDNPTNFFTASALNSRASDLGLLMDSVSNAVQTISAADKGIKAITKLVESAQATARQALQTAATVDTVTGGTPAQPGQNASVDTDDLTTLEIDSSSAGTITINGEEIELEDEDDFDAILAKIQGGATDGGYSVANDNGVLTITSLNGEDLEIGGDEDTLTALGLSEGTTEATPPTPAVPGTPTSAPNPKRAELVAQYNDLLTQIDQLARDSGFNGVNLLTSGNDLEVIFNEDGSSKLTVEGKSLDSAGLDLAALDTDAFDTNEGINGVLDSLKGAIEELRTQASKFGSNLSVVETRQSFTKDMINVLQTGAANLTLADVNEEAANLLALQTRQQLSSTALSMASQADQQVLRLF